MAQNKVHRSNHTRKLKEGNNETINGNPVLQAFQAYASELDEKHDRHEKIVKISRDITIEAKRIIFLLHTIDGKKNHESILAEAQHRLNKLICWNFNKIAKALHGQDPYQYRWAYSAGLQEFVEAYSYMEYLCYAECPNDTDRKPMSDWNACQEKMRYEDVLVAKNNEDVPDEKLPVTTDGAEETAEKQKFEFFIDPTEFMLGVTDLTGELMRRCINSLGSGNTKTCLETCKVLQQFYTGYISLSVPRCRELSRKIYTMRQSVLKSENACYNVKVRGGEAAKWGAVLDKVSDDVDEGFF